MLEIDITNAVYVIYLLISKCSGTQYNIAGLKNTEQGGRLRYSRGLKVFLGSKVSMCFF